MENRQLQYAGLNSEIILQGSQYQVDDLFNTLQFKRDLVQDSSLVYRIDTNHIDLDVIHLNNPGGQHYIVQGGAFNDPDYLNTWENVVDVINNWNYGVLIESSKIDLTTVPYFIYNGVSKQFILDQDIQDAEIGIQKTKGFGAGFLSYFFNGSFNEAQLQTYITNGDVDLLTFTYNRMNFSANDIPYSVLNLNNQIQNSDIISLAFSKLTGQINPSTQITNSSIGYSKLNLSNSIVNSDISSIANISQSKLQQFVYFNRGGIDTQYILNSDITSIQFSKITGQIDPSTQITNSSIGYSKLNLSNSIVSGDLTNQSVLLTKIDYSTATDGYILKYTTASQIQWSANTFTGMISIAQITATGGANSFLKSGGGSNTWSQSLETAWYQNNTIALGKLVNGSAYRLCQMDSTGSSWVSGFLDATNSVQNNTIPLSKLQVTALNNYYILRQNATSTAYENSLLDLNMIPNTLITYAKLNLGTNILPLNVHVNSVSNYSFAVTDNTKVLQYKLIFTNADFNLYFSNTSQNMIDMNKLNKNNAGLSSTAPYVMIDLLNNRLNDINSIYNYGSSLIASSVSKLYYKDNTWNQGPVISTLNPTMFFQTSSGYAGCRVQRQGFIARQDGEMIICSSNSNGVGACSFANCTADFGATLTVVSYINQNTGAYVVVSDKNRKKDIDYTCQKQRCYESIKRIKMCKYKMKEDMLQKTQLGIISQDFMDSNDENLQECIQLHDETLMLDTSKISMLQLSTIQHLQDKVEQQQQQIDDLTKMVFKILKKIDG